MSQPIHTLARTLLVPAAFAAVAFAGQSAASASTLNHYRAPVSSAVAASTSEAHFSSYAHFRGHVFGARPQAHFVQHVLTRWA